MAELPVQKRERLLGLGLPKADVVILTDELATANYFDATCAAGAAPKSAANWIMGDLMAHCKVGGRVGWEGGGGATGLTHVAGSSQVLMDQGCSQQKHPQAALA